MKTRKKIIVSMLIAVGIVASVCIYLAFNKNMTDVLVATRTINSNSLITGDMFVVKSYDKNYLPSNYYPAEYAETLIGKYTNIGLTEGSVITEFNVASESTKKAATIASGKVLLSIDIDRLPQGVTSQDYVNLLIGASTIEGNIVTTYQKILVTNTYSDENGVVTGLELEVTPEQAQYIQFAQLNGEISVSLLPLDYISMDLPITSSLVGSSNND